MAWMYTSWYALIGACLSTIGLVGVGAMLSLWAWYHITQRLSTRSTWSELYSSKADLGPSGSTSVTKEDICRVDVDVDDYVLITDQLCPATVTAGVGTLRQVAVSSLHDLLLGLATLRTQAKERENSTPPSSNPTEDTDRDVGPPAKENVTVPRPNTERRMSLLNRHLPVCETLEGAYVPTSDIPAYMVTTETMTNPVAQMMPAVAAKPALSAAMSPPPHMDNHSAHVNTTTSTDTDVFRTYVNHQVEAIFPKDSMRRETFLSIVEEIMFASTAQLVIDAIFRAFRVTMGVLRHWDLEHTLVGAFPREAQGEITYQVQFILNTVTFTWDKRKYGSDLTQTMSLIAQHLRDQGRQPTCSEYLAFQLAYYKLSKGHRMDLSPHMPMGSPGFRPYTQTYISIADPGEGHVLGTTRSPTSMQGVVIHVETKSRQPEEHPADKRPSLLDLSKVCLHAGSAAPTSTSVGTVVHSEHGGFDEQFWHTVHVVSSEATAAFHRGAAQYKVIMDGLSTSQVVRYMRALTFNVSRDRFTQHLSAAWTLNQIIFDDYEREKPKHLVSNKDIAMRILEITSLGGFDDVCLTGGSDDNGSKDILGFEEALVFSHQAHMLGLATQVSDIKFDEIRHAVFAGVDIIGIAGEKALRFMDSDSGILGPHTQDIQRILQSRNDAAKSIRGRGAHLLVRLDTMLFEGTISQHQNILREQLLKALKSNHKAEIENLLNELHVVCCEDTASRHRIEGTATRLCRATAPLLHQCADSPTEWRVFLARLSLFLQDKDYLNLVEEYESEPWLTYRQKYTNQLKAMTV